MRTTLLSLLTALTIADVAWAGQTGDIRGRVVDLDGAPISGAVLVLSGTDLGGELTVTSNVEGTFAFLELDPGTYTLTVAVDGLTLASAVVTVALDRATQVPFEVDPSLAWDEIVVQEVRPVVDATSSSIGTTMSEEFLQNLPVGRSTTDVVNMLPGVYGRIDTSSGGGGDGNPSVRGEGQYGNNYQIDGLMTRDPATKTVAQDVNFDAIEEIQVYTDGAPAEYGQFTGMMVNVVTKDGGDEHHGSAALFYSQHAWARRQYDIFDPAQGVEVPTDKARFRSPNLALTSGGPIVKEKLWYFGALNLGYDWLQAEGVDREGALSSGNGQLLGKLTWFVGPNLTLRYLLTQSWGLTNNESASQLVAPEAQTDRQERSASHLLTLTWLPDAQSNLQLRAGFNQLDLDVVPASGDRDTPSATDAGGRVFGNARDYDLNRRLRVGGGLSFTRFFDNAVGTHKFKTGAEYWWLKETREVINTGATTLEWIDQDGQPTGQLADFGTAYRANPGAGYDCRAADFSDCGVREHWSNVGPLGNKVHTFFMYMQDDWSPIEQLTLNLGLRLDVEDGINDSGERAPTEDPQQYALPPEERDAGKLRPLFMPAPRVGFSIDPMGDSKTRIFGHYGWYYDIGGGDFWSWANQRSADGYIRYVRDANGDWQWSNTQDPVSSPLIYAKNLRPARLDKVIVGVERELVPLLKLGVRGILSRTQGIPEDVDVDLDNWYIINPSIKERRYRALEVVVERQYDGVWQLLASYTLSESFGHTPGQFELAPDADAGSNGNNVGVYLDDVGEASARAAFYDNGLGWILDGFKGLGRYSITDPKYHDDAGYYGYMPYHSFHAFKVNGSYTMPWGTTLGLVYEFDSGHAWQKRTYVDFYGFDGFAQGRGTRFMPMVHYVDVRLAHRFTLRKEQSVELTFDVFNLPGFMTPITYYENDAPGFGATLYRQSPRSIRGGLRYRW